MASTRRIVRQPVMRPPVKPNIGTLLLFAYRSFERELFASLHEAGHDALRPKHGAVLANLDERGTRLTTLARRGQIGTSAMGELVDELERLRYVERRPDPEDRRAKLVVPTAGGADVIDLATRTIRRIEAAYAGRLGQARHAALRDALNRLADRRSAGRQGDG